MSGNRLGIALGPSHGRAEPHHRKKRVSILGSTGSVGQSTVALISENSERYEVAALTANGNVELLARQARLLNPRLAVVADPGKYTELKSLLGGTGITLAAGPLIMAAVKKHGATLVPVDSEHSAIFQVFDFNAPASVERIILTASGGPFLKSTREAMAAATPEQAVAHPNWSMGAKISVDSATMMNKGLELIEACRLFPVPADRIDIVVHPQSIVHSLVSYVDGSVLAQLGSPDMRTPIAVALGWPDRIPAGVKRLDLAAIGRLDFLPPDENRFPALQIARAALASGAGGPAVLNAANEIAVSQFLARRIGFLDIARVVEETLGRVAHDRLENLADLRVLDGMARETALYLSRGAAVAQ